MNKKVEITASQRIYFKQIVEIDEEVYDDLVEENLSSYTENMLLESLIDNTDIYDWENIELEDIRMISEEEDE